MNEGLRTHSGGRIDRSQPLRFSFDGRSYTGFAGDTLASALLANGVHLLGRSFKYHRPRGLLGAGVEEPNALVTVRRDAARITPNLRATQVELYEGLDACSQNRWPSLAFDLGAVNDLLAPFIPAGFYYKTFMWPRSAWHRLYEPRIRASAGLGRSPTLADPDHYAPRHAHCDVLVVGAGPAGLAAAQAAATAGARVVLCDEQNEPGGSLLADDPRHAPLVDGQPGPSWQAGMLASLAAHPRVTVLARATAYAFFPHNLLGINQRLTDHLARPRKDTPRERQWLVRAREVVLATGAIERPLVFPGNDRPGVMLAGAARTLLNRYGVLPGTRAVLVTADDSAYEAAIELQRAGVFVAAIADTRAISDPPPGVAGANATQLWMHAAQRAGIPVLTHATVTGTTGRRRVNSVTLARHSGLAGSSVTHPCDLVLMSGGFTPSVHLYSQSRSKLTWSESQQAFLPGAPAERVRCAGACRGVADLAAAASDGAAAGAAAAQAALDPARIGVQPRAPATPPPPVLPPHANHAAHAATPQAGGFIGALPRAGTARGRAFVDWQNDVTVKDLALAMREGFRSIEHIKRYTTTGMATDQGKTSNLNALAVVARAQGRAIPEVGFTTFRMPYTPVSFGSFAGPARGALFDPVRTTPMHDWAAAQGAVFEDVGLWKRARYFPLDGEDMHAAVARECKAVRAGCGLFDASTLGKIEVVGRDAVEFMNRLYVNNWSSLAAGRCRYGILLRDDGYVYDDGVVARMAPDVFHVTTTTGGAPRVLALMEDYLQTEWPQLSVWLTSTTEQWAVIAVQGPKAREVLAPLVDMDLGAAVLPHMSAVTGSICGVPMRLFRVSFTGELGFEVNVPADYGPAVLQAIHASGQPHGITAYGTETMHVLRAEKGYVIVGQDTDGTVTPDDAGLSWAIGKNKPDFVGKRSLSRAALVAPHRRQLVGLRTRDPAVVLEEGAQVMERAGARPPTRPLGHVTSSYHSAVLGHPIALALVAGGRDRMGKTLYVAGARGDVEVEVTGTVFYDPTGARLNG
ncbi:MAG: sarcosine oxidase subunit alpha family protein [Proteobacteria bacterium]|nr:sarcosine oxidase subunit alpha family protein [Pseudomonadota bacterium]